MIPPAHWFLTVSLTASAPPLLSGSGTASFPSGRGVLLALLCIAEEHFVFPSPCTWFLFVHGPSFKLPSVTSPVLPQLPHWLLSTSPHLDLRNTHLLVSWTQQAIPLLQSFVHALYPTDSSAPALFGAWKTQVNLAKFSSDIGHLHQESPSLPGLSSSWPSHVRPHGGGSRTTPGPLRSTQGAISLLSSADLEQSLNCIHAMVAMVIVKAS